MSPHLTALLAAFSAWIALFSKLSPLPGWIGQWQATRIKKQVKAWLKGKAHTPFASATFKPRWWQFLGVRYLVEHREAEWEGDVLTVHMNMLPLAFQRVHEQSSYFGS